MNWILGVALAVTTAVPLGSGAAAAPVRQLPTPPVEGLDPDVREAINRAHARAVAEPLSSEAAGRLGMLLQAHELNRSARQAYERAIDLNPDAFDWHYYLAIALEQLSELERARDQMVAALVIQPGHESARYRYAELLYKLGDFKESADQYAALLDERPDAPLAQFGLARVKQQSGDLDAARDLYARAIDIYPTFGSAYFGLAVVESRLGLRTEARAHAELARLHAGDRPPLAEPFFDRMKRMATGVLARIERANELSEAGHVAEAAALYEELLEDAPDHLNATLNLLALSDFLGRHERVDQLYARASKVYPDVPALHRIYGGSLIRRGRLDAAAATLRKALTLDETDAETLTMLGELLSAQGESALARSYFQRALDVRPSHRVARFDLARALLAAGDTEGALPELMRVIAEDAGDRGRPGLTVSAMILAAVALDRRGDPDAARRQIETARQAATERRIPDLLADIDRVRQQLDGRR